MINDQPPEVPQPVFPPCPHCQQPLEPTWIESGPSGIAVFHSVLICHPCHKKFQARQMLNPGVGPQILKPNS